MANDTLVQMNRNGLTGIFRFFVHLEYTSNQELYILFELAQFNDAAFDELRTIFLNANEPTYNLYGMASIARHDARVVDFDKWQALVDIARSASEKITGEMLNVLPESALAKRVQDSEITRYGLSSYIDGQSLDRLSKCMNYSTQLLRKWREFHRAFSPVQASS